MDIKKEVLNKLSIEELEELWDETAEYEELIYKVLDEKKWRECIEDYTGKYVYIVPQSEGYPCHYMFVQEQRYDIKREGCCGLYTELNLVGKCIKFYDKYPADRDAYKEIKFYKQTSVVIAPSYFRNKTGERLKVITKEEFEAVVEKMAAKAKEELLN